LGGDGFAYRRGAAEALVEQFASSAEDHGIKTIFTLMNTNQTELQYFFSRIGLVPGKMIHYQNDLSG
jgi:N-acetylglutamate synthase-like GNAT family acetyltransferase